MTDEHLNQLNLQMQSNSNYNLQNSKNQTDPLFSNQNKTENFLNSNSNNAKNFLNNSAYGGENLNISVSTVHTINMTIGTNKNLDYTNLCSSSNINSNPNIKSNNNSNLNLTSNSNTSGNLISKFSPLPKPDFSGLEKKENCLSYINKGSYKKPKSNVPDSPIKTPHKFASTPGNAYKLGKKNVKKSACRKLNFFVENEETDELSCNDNSYNVNNIAKIDAGPCSGNNNDNKNYDCLNDFARCDFNKFNQFGNLDIKIENSNLNNSNQLNNLNNLNNFSNCNFNFENIKFGCLSSNGFKSENDFIKNPFLTINADSLNTIKMEQQEQIMNETNKLMKNCKKRVFFCEKETSEFQLNDPVNDIDMINNDNNNNCDLKFNSAKKSNNGSKKSNSKTNSISNGTPKKLKMLNLNSNSKKNLLRNKYKKQQNEDSDFVQEEKENIYSDSEMEISEFNILNYENKNSNYLQHTNSKLSLNESRNSSEFHSKQESFNLKSSEKNNKKNFDVYCNNHNNNNFKNNEQNENEIYNNFINNFSVSKFNLEPELNNQLDYHRGVLMPTNYEKENPHFNPKFNFMEENKFSFGKREDDNCNMSDKKYNFYATNPFNYNEIMSEINDYSRRASDINVSKFENDFRVITTLDSGSFGVVYKCVSNFDGNIYAIKKTKKMVGKGETNIILTLINDLNAMWNFNCLSNFILKNMESWLEEGLLYIKQEYCEYGDLLDFLQKLEEKNYNFDSDFYWDIFFEMICGLKYFHESGYLHLDIKPQNFLVALDGTIKLGDFNLSRKKETYDADYFEGDSVYLAPEILEANKFKQLSEKCDIFSLGLSCLEILCKIELPQNGSLWHEIRSAGFKIPAEFLGNSNLKSIPINLISLIQDMIVFESRNRKDLNFLIDTYPELLFRYERLLRNDYSKTYLNFIKSEILVSEIDDHFIAKRSNSYKLSFNNASM